MNNNEKIDLREYPAFKEPGAYEALVENVMQAHDEIVSGTAVGVDFEKVMRNVDEILRREEVQDKVS